MDKIYCGSGKEITTQYGVITKVSFMEKDLDTLRNNLENGWVNISVMKKKDPQPGKPTHYCVIDQWKPDNAKGDQPQPSVNTDDDEPLPF